MPKKESRGYFPTPEHQADATLDQANPVSGTQYEVLATTRNARIISVAVRCTWTVQPTPLQVHITIDGNTLSYSFTDPVTNRWYIAIRRSEFAEDSGILAYLTTAQDMTFLVEGRSVRVTAETTGGTVSNLSARVKYAQW